MTVLHRVLVPRAKQRLVGKTMGAQIGAKLRALGDAAEGRSLAVPIRRSVRKFVLLGLLASVVPAFLLDLPVQSIAQDGTPHYLLRGRLRSRLREVLTVLGDRLERAGKERVTILGSITLASPTAVIPFRFVWELPGRARLDLQVVPARVLILDGITLTGALSRRDEDLIESLFYDTAERFFLGQTQGLGTRFLGSRFRLDDGKTPNYRGFYYDIYEVIDPVRLGPQVRMQPKLYYLNSDTLLLERVRYQLNRDSSRTNVEVQIDNWQRGNRQSVPGRIVRLENGQAVFTVTVISAVIGPRQNDGLFAP